MLEPKKGLVFGFIQYSIEHVPTVKKKMKKSTKRISFITGYFWKITPVMNKGLL